MKRPRSPPSLPRVSEVLLAPAQPLLPPPGRCLGSWSRGCGSPEALGLDLGEPWLPIRSCWPGVGVVGSVRGRWRVPEEGVTADGGGRRLQASGETWGLNVGAALGKWTGGARGGGGERGVSAALGVVQSRALCVSALAPQTWALGSGDGSETRRPSSVCAED